MDTSDAELEDTDSPNWETMISEEVAYEQETSPSQYAEFVKSCKETEIEEMENILAGDPERLFLWKFSFNFAAFQQDPGATDTPSDELWAKQHLQTRGYSPSSNELTLCVEYLRLTPKPEVLRIGLGSQEIRSMQRNAKVGYHKIITTPARLTSYNGHSTAQPTSPGSE